MLGLDLACTAQRTPAWWSAGAIFAADFVNDRYMRNGISITQDDALTVSRPSGKLALTSTGQWLGFAGDTLARTDLGASIEPAATNQIQNSTMTGATLGTPGAIPAGWSMPATANGLTRQIVSVGTSKGLPAIDVRFSGFTTTESFLNIDLVGTNYVATLPGDVWSLSCAVALISGSLSGLIPALACRLRAAMLNGSGSYIGELMANPALDFTAGAVFQAQSATVGNASARFLSPYFQFWYTSGANIDFTLRISAPQLERVANTSPILTTGGVALRAADEILMHLPGSAQINAHYSDGSTASYVADTTPFPLQTITGRRTVLRVEATDP